MNGKIKKILVIFAISCSLQFGTFAFTCKKGVSYKEDREGTFEEVKGALEDNTCGNPNAVCISLKVDEITVDGELSECCCFISNQNKLFKFLYVRILFGTLLFIGQRR